MWSPLLALLGAVQLGDAVVRGPGGADAVTVTASRRFAGAIDSLKWHGFEFLDSADHGRLLQSASNFDAGGPITDETFNPTEGGSRLDGAGQTSTSRLLNLKVTGDTLETQTQMAFWLAPRERSGDHPAKNTAALSDHILRKRVVVGQGGEPRRLRVEVTFQLPGGEHHRKAVFESLTGYMPATFSRFWQFDAKAQKLRPLDDGPGEQASPVVFSTADGAYAMGVYSPDPRAKGYGRWRFARERVVKWNCVFRVADPAPGSAHTFSHELFVGTLAQVEADLIRSLRTPAKR